eukprot:CAMPEP_0194506798 /NCGR_PEP_ID=MMETSP0253-20130528/35213_1 /TAXON_ID=2966 /ORGANISM="Noctiluca scintillans" /LENGTH=62 /DNA_ID=CAMNT_0039349575 /DNA_START=102 /DNA_END=287 /DNA_ORIENTATION=-
MTQGQNGCEPTLLHTCHLFLGFLAPRFCFFRGMPQSAQDGVEQTESTVHTLEIGCALAKTTV